tara:strand:+ start:1108 stop:1512 length:405 start_codon:yes stop_codon:yes gene_type:complete
MEEKNIVNVLPSYSRSGVEGTILELKRELREQKEVNSILKESNNDEKIQEIKNFVQRNEGDIDDQIYRLGQVIEEIKKIVNDNLNLEKSQENYDELIQSHDSKRVAEKIVKLKNMKKDALIFLESAGIILPHIN